MLTEDNIVIGGFYLIIKEPPRTFIGSNLTKAVLLNQIGVAKWCNYRGVCLKIVWGSEKNSGYIIPFDCLKFFGAKRLDDAALKEIATFSVIDVTNPSPVKDSNDKTAKGRLFQDITADINIKYRLVKMPEDSYYTPQYFPENYKINLLGMIGKICWIHYLDRKFGAGVYFDEIYFVDSSIDVIFVPLSCLAE